SHLIHEIEIGKCDADRRLDEPADGKPSLDHGARAPSQFVHPTPASAALPQRLSRADGSRVTSFSNGEGSIRSCLRSALPRPWTKSDRPRTIPAFPGRASLAGLTQEYLGV